MTKHTPGRIMAIKNPMRDDMSFVVLDVPAKPYGCTDAAGNQHVQLPPALFPAAASNADAKHIAACWNAFESIGDPADPEAAITAMREALEALADWADEFAIPAMGDDTESGHGIIASARAAMELCGQKDA